MNEAWESILHCMVMPITLNFASLIFRLHTPAFLCTCKVKKKEGWGLKIAKMALRYKSEIKYM